MPDAPKNDEQKLENNPADKPDETKPHGDAQKPEAEGTDWKSEARKWEKLAKDNKDAASRLAEIEESKKSAEEKLAARAEKAENETKSSQSELSRLRVAMRKGLSEAQAKRLIGSTEEELEADADELLSSFKVVEAPKPKPGEKVATKPDDSQKQGSDSEEIDPNKLAAEYLNRKR